VLALDLDVVDSVRPQGQLRPSGVREQIADQAASRYLPGDQALARGVRYHLIPADVREDERFLALGLQYPQFKGSHQLLAALRWGCRWR